MMSYTSSAPGVSTAAAGVSCVAGAATDGLQMAARMEKCDAMTAMSFHSILWVSALLC